MCNSLEHVLAFFKRKVTIGTVKYTKQERDNLLHHIKILF